MYPKEHIPLRSNKHKKSLPGIEYLHEGLENIHVMQLQEIYNNKIQEY